MTRLRRTVRDQILAETRQRLLEAAASEFAREGYTGANINRISQAAGFAKGDRLQSLSQQTGTHAGVD